MSVRDCQGGYWLGVDIGKESSEASVAFGSSNPREWTKLPTYSFSMTRQGIRALVRWLERFGGVSACVGVCVESTGVYSFRFAEKLVPFGLPEVSIINPCWALAYRRSLGMRDKNDRVDAAVLALYGRHHEPAPVRRLSEVHAQLGRLWRTYMNYQEEALRFRNRLEQALDRDIKQLLRQTIRHCEKLQKTIWQRIEKLVRAEPELARDAALLCSIPGVGMKTAVTLLGELGDLRQWGRKQIVSFVGLFPRQYESGSSVYKKPRMAKGGNAHLRRALFFPALSIKRSRTPLGDFGRRLQGKGKAKMAVVGALMARLLVLARGVVVSGVPYDPKRYGMNQLPT